ncbi:uncharacterized protein LOC129913398 [Episyrphus balteatus]|uniref:uncharacterized protein LOC129913398 n=1 Tax=Episyrphus balteatus TaxID=286459 RepID=UPI0024851C18|nr:uncharacterized protein LOC129913398 [Episyrphus balteatus]
MNCILSLFRVILLIVLSGSVFGVPISDEVDQVPPLASPPIVVVNKDDGSSDLKPPPPPSESDNQYSGSSSVSSEVTSYDPNIYSGLLPAGGVPGYPDPFPGYHHHPYPGYPPHPPPGYPSPYVVQTGYEGYLLPSAPQVQSIQSVSAVPLSDSLSFLQGIMPASMVTWIVRSMAIVMGTVTMVIMGGALTTALCSLTPLCSISFKSLKFLNWNETARNVGMIVGNEMTPERVRRAANFVHTAIRKYSELQKAFAGDEN